MYKSIWCKDLRRLGSSEDYFTEISISCVINSKTQERHEMESF